MSASGSWDLPRDRSSFDARVVLQGDATAEATITLRDGDDVVSERTERIRVDGRRELVFDEVELPGPGSYQLTLLVTAPGVRQSQTVTVSRG